MKRKKNSFSNRQRLLLSALSPNQCNHQLINSFIFDKVVERWIFFSTRKRQSNNGISIQSADHFKTSTKSMINIIDKPDPVANSNKRLSTLFGNKFFSGFFGSLFNSLFHRIEWLFIFKVLKMVVMALFAIWKSGKKWNQSGHWKWLATKWRGRMWNWHVWMCFCIVLNRQSANGDLKWYICHKYNHFELF